jgi:hypothetical protein
MSSWLCRAEMTMAASTPLRGVEMLEEGILVGGGVGLG